MLNITKHRSTCSRLRESDAAVLLMRKINPEAARHFRRPLVRWPDILGIAACLTLPCSRFPWATGNACSAGWDSAGNRLRLQPPPQPYGKELRGESKTVN